MAKKQSITYETITPEELAPGMTVRIHQKIKDVNPKGEEKERVQIFEGMIIKRHGGREAGATFTARKEAKGGWGVEKIFPLHLPSIEKIDLVRQAKVRRSKLYYLRDYHKKLKEKVAKKKTD